MKGKIADTLSLVMIGSVLFGFVLKDKIGEWEGTLFPVMGDPGKVKISIIRVEGDWTYFSIKGEKITGGKWKKTKWFFGDRDGDYVPVPSFEHLDSPNVKAKGEHFWPKSRIRMPPEDLINNSFSNAFHDRGGWRWWLVKSDFYR